MTTPTLLRVALLAACLSTAVSGFAHDDNPLLTVSPLPFQYPQFDKIKDSDYRPAFEKGLTEKAAEFRKIADNPEAPTFDNTIVAMERSGLLLGRVDRIFSNLNACNTDEEMQKINAEMASKLAASSDAIYLDPVLFARVKTLYDARATLGLDPESLRLLERYHEDFVRAGANLSDTDKAKLRELNGTLASLSALFTKNTLKERNASAVVVDSKEELAGLSDAQIAAAASAAKADHHDGKYEIRLVNTTGQPPLGSLRNRDLRLKIMAASEARGSRGGPYDNQKIVVAMIKARAEKAALLGFPSWAAYRVANQTAKTVEAVDHLLGQLAPAAEAKAKAEAAEQQAIVSEEGATFTIGAADWDMYSEKVRKAKYDFDESQLKPYFELNHVLFDGVFYAAHELYGISFKERKDLPVYNPDVRTFEVFDADGSHLGFLIEDFYARPSKNGGAWMNAYVSQSELFGLKAIVANHHNIPKPPPGQPTLLTYDETVTLFHEFGHGLHGLFSHVRYPRFSGTAVPRDYVEYPSQVNEMWAAWPEVICHYARHYQTGEPLPQALVDKIVATQKFNQGFATLEYLKPTLVDWEWHKLPAEAVPSDVNGFEASVFKKYAVDLAAVPPRYHTTYFSHIFTSDYSADYFAYIWADVLVADSIEWFTQHGGLTRKNGQHFRDTVLSHGGSVDPMVLFTEFTGGQPDVQALIHKRGLDEVAK